MNQALGVQHVNLVRLAPQIFFFGLFPVYFAYHALLSAALIPPLLGGGWTVWTGPGALILGAMVVLRGADRRVHVPIAVLAAWVAVYAVAHALFGAEFQRQPILMHESLKLVFGWVCLYGIGTLFRPDAVFSMSALYALGAMALAALFLLGPETLHSGLASYMGFATSIVFVTLFCLALAPIGLQPVVIAAGLAGLFALGSRADFLGLVCVAILWGLVHIRHQRFATAAKGLLAGALALMATASWIGATKTTQGTQGYAVTRQMELMNVSKSQSLQIRIELLRKGWTDIKASPFAGVYGGQMRDGGIWGNYIHMVLSAWRQFGLPAFLLYFALCAAPALASAWQVLVRRSDDPMWTLTLLVGGFTFLQVLVAKSVFWPLPALAWGLLAARLMHNDAHTAAR